MTVLSCYSIKGGVGKTALAVNLAFALQRRGHRILLVDLDPQGAAAFHFRLQPSPKLKFRGGSLTKLRENIQSSDYPNLDVLPSNFAYRKLDVLLNQMKKSRGQLGKFLKTFRGDYQAIILDCPPNITLLSENVFRASDAILVPVIPTPLSQRTLEQLLQFFKEKEIEPPVLPFFSMVQGRKRLHKETMAAIRNECPSLFETVIPFSADVENMGLVQKPLLDSAPARPAAIAYQALCIEIIERCLIRPSRRQEFFYKKSG